jgi:hypothetical protein
LEKADTVFAVLPPRSLVPAYHQTQAGWLLFYDLAEKSDNDVLMCNVCVKEEGKPAVPKMKTRAHTRTKGTRMFSLCFSLRFVVFGAFCSIVNAALFI